MDKNLKIKMNITPKFKDQKCILLKKKKIHYLIKLIPFSKKEKKKKGGLYLKLELTISSHLQLQPIEPTAPT